MPNWVSITLRVKGQPSQLAAFKDEVATKDSCFDFNTFISMPKELDIESGSVGDIGFDVFYGDPSSVLRYPWVVKEGIKTVEELQEFLDRTNPQYRAIASQYYHNLNVYGCKTWYEWSVNNWGTKWNASDSYLEEEDGDLVYHFNTAWSFPEPIMEKLLEKYPTLHFEGEAIEESGAFAFTFVNIEGAWEFTEIEIPEEPEEEDEDNQ